MKMRPLLFLLLSWFIVIPVWGQDVQVIDKVSLATVPHVAVYTLDEKHSVVTGLDGEADLSGFPRNSTLVFQHASFQELVIPYETLKDQGFIAKLTPSTVNLDEVVISANNWEQKRSEVPNKISVINKREIEFTNPQTSADLLGTGGEVFIQKSQLGGGSPMIRGFAANSVLLVYDGVRMNNAIFRSGNLQNVILMTQIPLNLLR